MTSATICTRRAFASVVLIVSLAGAASAAPAALRFDCGPIDQQRLAEGFQALSGRQAYSAECGFGWLKPWGLDTEGRPHDDARFVDGITAREHVDTQPTENDVTFRADLPDGVYAVTIWVGDPNPREGRLGICAAVNGRVVIPPPGVGGWGAVTQRVLPAVVDAGVLDLNFFIHGTGGAARLALCALTIEPITDAAQEQAMRRQWDAAAPVDAPRREIALGDLVLTEVARRAEPASAKRPADWPVRTSLAFTRPNPGDLLAYAVPRETEITRSLSAFACAGEDQPIWFAVHALRDLADVRVSCSDLRAGDAAIAAHHVEIFTLTTRPRALSDRPGQSARLVCDLMERRIPFDVKAGESQGLYLRVHVPPGTPAGAYTGAVRLSPAGGEPLDVALSLRVLPIELQRPAGKVWHLFSDTHRWTTMHDLARRDEIDDMARHGINSLIVGYPPTGASYIERDGRIVDADYGVIEQGLREARAAGMDGPVFVAATPGIVFRLHGWSLGHRGSARHTLTTDTTDRAIVIEHPDKTASTELGSVSGTLFRPGESVRLEVRYRVEGDVQAGASVGFMKSYKRDSVDAGRVAGRLEAVGGWQTFTAVTRVPDDAPYATSRVVVSGGPGTLTIGEVRLLGPDGVIDHQVNGGFDRTLETVADDQEQWPADFAAGYVDAVKALCGAVERAGFEAWIEGTDEAGNNPKSAAREINELRWAKKAGYPTWCNLSPGMAERVSDVLDGVCYYANFLGGPDDCRRILDRAHERGQKLYYISSGCYVGQEFDLMPNRHGVGLFFWKSGADGTGIWTYQRPNGDPFNDFDGAYKEYALVLPPRQPGGPVVPTLGWEGVREGWRDYLYVHTLEQATARAQNEGRDEDAEIGRIAVDFIRDAVPWFDQAESRGHDNAAADRLRWLAAWATMRVGGLRDDAATDSASATPRPGIVRIQSAKADADEAPLQLTCTPVDASPTLDGRLDDPAWSRATVFDDFRHYAQPQTPASQKTVLRLAHDRHNLYLGFVCYEPDMAKLRAEATGPDANVFADDSIEVFLDTAHDQFNFYQLAFNAAGARFDMRCAGSNDFGESVYGAAYGRKKVRDAAWNGDWQVAASRYGDRWEAEVRIPFAAVGRDSDLWGIHVGRNRTVGGRETYALRSIGMFHQPARFTPMLLTGSRTGAHRFAPLDLPQAYWGRSELTLHWDGPADLVGRTVVTARDGATASFAAGVKDGALRMPYVLGETSAMAEWQIDDAAGRPAWRIRMPLEVPAVMSATNGRWVRMLGEREAPFDLDLNVSTKERQTHQLAVTLADAGGVVLDRAVVAPTGAHHRVTLDLSHCPPQLYRVVMSLTDATGAAAMTTEQALMVVPHFIPSRTPQ